MHARLGRRVTMALAAVVTAATIWVPTVATAATTHVTVTGRLQVVARDGVGGDTYVTELITGRRVLRLHGNPRRWPRTGTTVAASGTLDGHVLTVDTLTTVAAATTPPTSGSLTMLVVPVYWSDSQPAAPTIDDLKAQVIEATSTWIATASHGHVSGITGDVAPWQRISQPNGCDQNAIHASAVSAATNAGFAPSSYQHVVAYFPPDGDCSWSGLGDVGGSRMWLNGWSDTSVVAHELGHNLGLVHSHSLTCHDASAIAVTESATCDPYVEYGDGSDTMGSGQATEYNAAQQSRLGWLTAAVTAPCVSGVSLASYEADTGARAVHIAGGVGANGQPRSYWLEFRQPVGVDDGLGTGLTDGVLLHLDQALADPANMLDSGPKLLDGTPGSQATDMDDAALPAGHSVTTLSGTTVHVASTSASGAVVDLSTDRPSAPVGVAASVTGGAPTLSWTAPGCLADAVTSYAITVSGGTTATVNAPATTAVLPAALLSTDHTFTVTPHTTTGVGLAAVAPATAPRLDSVTAMDHGVHVRFEPSVSNGGRPVNLYAVTVWSATSAPATTYWGPKTGQNDAYPTGLVDGTAYQVTVAPLLGDGSLGPATAPVAVTPAPFTVLFDAPAAGGKTGASTVVRWHYNRPTTWGPNCYLDGRFVGCTAGATTMSLSGLTAGTHKVEVETGDDYGNVKAPLTWTVDTRAPAVTMTAPAAWSLTGATTVAWTGSDPTGSGIRSYDVRVRSGAWNGELGSTYTTVAAATTATHVAVKLAAGRTYCYSVRARNGLGTTSAWTAQRCVATPLDDRSLTRSSGWSLLSGSGYYLATATRSTTAGTTLVRTGVHAVHLAVVAMRCPTCGSVSVVLDNRTTLATLSLYASTTQYRVVLGVPLPSRLSTGHTITLRVTSRSKSVVVDGLLPRLF